MVEDSFDDKRWVVARGKFGLIAPVVNNTYPDKNKTAYFRRVEGTPVTFEDGQVLFVKASTLQGWLYKYEQGGLSALLPVRRSDKGAFRHLDDEVAASIRALHKRFPKMPATVIYERLLQDGIITRSDVSLSTIQRFMRREFCATRCVNQIERRAFEADVVNGIWQADTLYGPFVSEDGVRGRAYLQTIIDDKSRLITGSRFTLSDDTASFQSLLKHAVLTYGTPAKLYVDNGGAYRNAQLSTICAQVGIVLSHAPVRDGAAKGKIERLNRTIRMKFLSGMAQDCGLNLSKLNDKLASWVIEYNSTNHSSTGQKPVELWSESAKGVRRIDPSRADELFRNRVQRAVNNDSTLRLDKVSYDVPMGHAGQRVQVHFSPGAIDDVWVCFEGCVPERIHPTNKVANAHRHRAGSRYRVDYAAMPDAAKEVSA